MKNDNFLRACRREATDYTPIWLMRQAGRYMAEYRKLREKADFLTMCKTPELAAEVTMQPINRFDLDAAIIFADILLPVEGMGINLEFKEKTGPIIHNPVRNRKDIDALRIIDAERDVPYLSKAISLVKQELNNKIPLIGFSSAPFTLASYMIEGGHSRNYLETKQMFYNEPEMWNDLMTKIVDVLIISLKAQVEAGVDVLQLFDSWVGCLSTGDYREYVLPHSKRLIDSVKGEGLPIIHFGTDTATLLTSMKEAGGDVIGADWRINLDEAWKMIGDDVGIQGNIDPLILFSNQKEIEKRVKDILNRAEGRPGHIFNLGHGILPKTPIDNVAFLIDTVHNLSRK
ncbi:MAG: uroporphyrinogen decarboxylase [Nitrospinae bacterium]|nr:uroporphyrinogen decarboxylase [Nitrospinota bacterium]